MSAVNMVHLDTGDNIEHMECTAATAVPMYENSSTTLNVADIEEYKNRMASLRPMERRTAHAFLDQGTESEYEWPLENETKDDGMIRKHFNATKLHRARQRQYENPEDQQLCEQRQQAHAERQSQYQNPEDQQYREQRLQADAERHSKFRNPPDEQLSQQRHEIDAARRRQFRNPPDEQLSQERHEAHADE